MLGFTLAVAVYATHFGPKSVTVRDGERVTTPELTAQVGPVAVWVERREGGVVSRVSDVRSIP